MGEQWLTTAQAAQLTGFHPDYIRKLMQQGKIEGKKWGREWQVSRASLLKYVKQVEKLGKRRGPKVDVNLDNL